MPALLQRLARDPSLYKVSRMYTFFCIPKIMLAPDLVMAVVFGHGAQNYVIRPPLSDHLNPPPCVGDHVWRAWDPSSRIVILDNNRDPPPPSDTLDQAFRSSVGSKFEPRGAKT